MNISLRQAKNVEEVDLVLKDPEIYARIAEDGISSDEYETPFDANQRYMMVMLDETIIGVWNLYPVNTSTLNIHANILKDFRDIIGDGATHAFNGSVAPLKDSLRASATTLSGWLPRPSALV